MTWFVALVLEALGKIHCERRTPCQPRTSHSKRVERRAEFTWAILSGSESEDDEDEEFVLVSLELQLIQLVMLGSPNQYVNADIAASEH